MGIIRFFIYKILMDIVNVGLWKGEIKIFKDDGSDFIKEFLNKIFV